MLTSAGGGSVLTEGTGSILHIIGLSIVATNGLPAVQCGPNDPGANPVPVLDFDNVSVDTNSYVVFAYPCKINARASHFNARVTTGFFIASPSTANIDRSVVEGHGIQALGGEAVVHVSNSLFVNQAASSGPSDPGPLAATTLGNGDVAGQASASFCTFVDTKLLLCGNGFPACSGGNDPGVCIDNSILTSSSGDVVNGSGCHVSYSIVTPQTAPLNGANNHLNVDPLFSGGASYTLKSSSPAIDSADPNAVDAIDLLGTPRPQGPHNDIGAYEYKP